MKRLICGSDSTPSSEHSIGSTSLAKKTLVALERDEQWRQTWLAAISLLDERDFVFLDESGANLLLTRLYARAKRGQRAVSKVVSRRGEKRSLIAAIHHDGLNKDHCLLVDGSVTTDVFVAYLEQVLLPALPAGKVLIMDNYVIHKSHRVRRLIEAHGCYLIYLPTYSPDFNPIELAFSKLKAYLRKVAAKTIDALDQAISDALDLVTPQDALAFFQHCGYASK